MTRNSGEAKATAGAAGPPEASAEVLLLPFKGVEFRGLRFKTLG